MSTVTVEKIMDTFKIEVVKTDEFSVSVDPEVWNKDALEEFAKHFWELENTEEVAKSLAAAVSRLGLEQFYEGFGYIKTFFNDGSVRKQWYQDKNGEFVIRKEEDYSDGLSITVISMDEDIDSNLID